MRAVMEARPIQCNHCRQRLWLKPNESVVICPGCKLQTNQENYGRLYKVDYSSTGNEIFGPRDKGLRQKGNFHFNCIWRGNDSNKSSLKSSLNIKPSPLLSLPSSRDSQPKKRAVLIGVTYNKAKYKLKGTINDVKNMRELLINSFGFKVEAILVLTEEEPEEQHKPTKKNIQKALQWLVDGSQRGDSLVFYFGGHGLRQPDFNGDERDGFDETICPVDFMKEGMILDNDINSTIVKPLKQGVTLHAIVDACHSGTILDLVYVYDRNRRKWEDNKPPSGANKATSGGLAICLSACEDNEQAFDSSAFTGKTMNGALTYLFVEAVKQHPQLSYGHLLDLIHGRIEEINNNISATQKNCLWSFSNGRLSQKPLLSSSQQFDIYNKRFIL